jgi:SAM-dependent methyltransferase
VSRRTIDACVLPGGTNEIRYHWPLARRRAPLASGHPAAVVDSLYTPEFFDALTDDAVRSAAVVVPLAMDLVKPTSVVDVGCGTGAWLEAFRGAGVQRILGIDGDYVDRRALRIPQDSFLSADLANGSALHLSATFDLSVSLEVAEHLPASAAPQFVQLLVRLAPVVLFSAAIPGQTGTGHINEQWPSYWAALFAQHGYIQRDPFRTRLWHDTRVAWWYRQNLFLYVHETRAQPALCEHLRSPAGPGSDLVLVHPDIIQRLDATITAQRDQINELSTGRGALRSLSKSLTRLSRRWLRLRTAAGPDPGHGVR